MSLGHSGNQRFGNARTRHPQGSSRGSVMATLNGTSVSDAGLRTLLRIESLGEIWLLSTKVTAEGVKEFRKARPKCGVSWVPNP